MFNNRSLIGNLVDTINVVDFEIISACREHKNNCTECGFSSDGKDCKGKISYNFLCKLLFKECPHPKPLWDGKWTEDD